MKRGSCGIPRVAGGERVEAGRRTQDAGRRRMRRVKRREGKMSCSFLLQARLSYLEGSLAGKEVPER
eukprot:754765-Hanusia_phi.AAC.1